MGNSRRSTSDLAGGSQDNASASVQPIAVIKADNRRCSLSAVRVWRTFSFPKGCTRTVFMGPEDVLRVAPIMAWW
ncbi:hypothetical protein D3C73_1537290 [compost metagenome]